MITFNEYLNIDIEEHRTIFDFYLNFLDELSSNDFPFNELLKLKGAGEKFLNSINKASFLSKEKKEEYLKLTDHFQDNLKRYRSFQKSYGIRKFLLVTNSHRVLVDLQDSFQNIYSSTLNLINEATTSISYYDDLKVNKFYTPDNSNKQKIKDLIDEAINLISDDDVLTESCKKNIINYLKKALQDLEKTNVNWTRFLGRIKETVIVLGALGSLAGGLTALSSAQEKLEQTTIIMQKTSVNVNFNVLNKIFNVQNIQNIKNIGSINTLLELTEEVDVPSK